MTGKGFRAYWVLDLLDGSVSKTAMVDSMLLGRIQAVCTTTRVQTLCIIRSKPAKNKILGHILLGAPPCTGCLWPKRNFEYLILGNVQASQVI